MVMNDHQEMESSRGGKKQANDVTWFDDGDAII